MLPKAAMRLPDAGNMPARRSARNATRHGLLSRLRLADDVQGVAAEIGAAFGIASECDDAALRDAVADLALAEMRLFRVRERQRALERLMASFVARGDFLCSGTARAVAAHLGLSAAGPQAEALTALGAACPDLAQLFSDPAAQALTQRRVLRRYAVEANRRRRTALLRLLDQLRVTAGPVAN